ncbi:MAG: excinuclease ABC subunit UvrA [Planctomycetota bacterium]
MNQHPSIRVYGACEHNLKHVNVEIPRGMVTVITGVSGSGKSSLAFDTIYAEGQRRYVESLSVHARQFLAQLQKPRVDRIEGLSPTIAIQQRVTSAGPRSTVATATELYDYLRVLFARCATPHCWECQKPITRQTVSQIVDEVIEWPERTRLLVLAPLVYQRRGKHEDILDGVLKRGFIRVRINGRMELIEDMEPLPGRSPHTIEAVVDRLNIKPEVKQRLADSVETALNLAQGRIIIAAESEDGSWHDSAYSTVLSCPDHTEVVVEDVNPQLFSFNSPAGACVSCHGLGTSMTFEPDLVVPDTTVTLAAGAVAGIRQAVRKQSDYDAFVEEFCSVFGVLPGVPFKNLSEEHQHAMLHGTARNAKQAFTGAIPMLQQRWSSTDSEAVKQTLQDFQSESPCEVCRGARLGPPARCFKIDGIGITDVTAMTVADASDLLSRWFSTTRQDEVAYPLVEMLDHRLRFLREVGVEYLSLDRAAQTLSGGEWQRLRLATQIGSALAGVCYVLDEPTVGLHPRDSRRLADILRALAALDNTVIVVEHDEEIIARASHMIDIGPGAGDGGGEVMAAGPTETVLASESSLTAGFLSGRQKISMPTERRVPDWKFSLELKDVSANNLKNIDVAFPLGLFVCVTGVSGSGKSTLVNGVLQRVLHRRIHRRGPRPGAFGRIVKSNLVDKIIQVDQSPIGRSPRSTPATYCGVLDLVRALFAKTREAKIRGYAPSRFSFNVKGGRCEHCEGQGVRRVSMHFLPDAFVTCDGCHGRRFNRETLEIRYRGKSIADVLDMRVGEAVNYFDNFENIKHRLQALKDVGLGYLSLGQSASTLSGGEAQRIKLASELQKTAEGHTLYLLDEPTTGLHFADVRNLLRVLQRFVSRGQTVLVVEHNLDVIKVADWIIDLGPEGGEGGGHIVAAGTPEMVASCEESHTGRFLRDRVCQDS